MTKHIKDVFFDLDRTLWDFEKSAKQTFQELFTTHKLFELGVPSVGDFHKAYTIHNDILWDKYRKGEIEKAVLRDLRFSLTLADFGIDDTSIGEKLGADYVRISPLKVNLFPYTMEILNYLNPKYNLHIITNGFSEVQDIKLQSSNIDKFFNEVITSEAAGYKKPDSRIFDFAFKKANTLPQNSIMIGDDYDVDIVGASDVGMEQIFFDPYSISKKGISTHHIKNLKEIERIL